MSVGGGLGSAWIEEVKGEGGHDGTLTPWCSRRQVPLGCSGSMGQNGVKCDYYHCSTTKGFIPVDETEIIKFSGSSTLYVLYLFNPDVHLGRAISCSNSSNAVTACSMPNGQRITAHQAAPKTKSGIAIRREMLP